MLLEGKKALILGLANNRSIAYGIAQTMKAQGARLAFNYVGDAIKKRVEPISEELGGEFTFQCDVCDDAQIQAAADLVTEDHRRGSYVIRPHRVQGVIMLLAGVADLVDGAFTQGTVE